MKFNKENLSSISTLFVILIIGIFIGFGIKDSVLGGETLGKNEISEKVVSFVNSNFFSSQGQTASIISLIEENGIYKIELKVGENQFPAFATKNGKYLFPEAIDMMPKIAEIPKSEKPNLKLFVMSFCPYGTQAEETLYPLLSLLKGKIDFELAYIISEANGEFSSLHGNDELNQDVRELCVAKYFPEKSLEFIHKINNSCTLENINTCWRDSANELEIDLNKIESCLKDESQEILNNQLVLNKQEFTVQDVSKHDSQEKISVYSSPTLIINDIVYDGSRALEGYQNAVCSAFTKQPKECGEKLSSTATEVQGGCGQ
jgi:glutaredoxin